MRLRVPTLVVAATLALSACGSSGSSSTSSPSASDSATGSITVFAAASLKESFTTIGTQFEAAHPGSKVTFNFGASSTLATQITQKAPADVFAAASTKTMDTVVLAGAASGPQTFAVNTMEIATPPKSTVTITSVADLAKPGVKVVVCQKAVPCGVAAAAVFTKNNVTVTPVSEEAANTVIDPDRRGPIPFGPVSASVVLVAEEPHAARTMTVASRATGRRRRMRPQSHMRSNSHHGSVGARWKVPVRRE